MWTHPTYDRAKELAYVLWINEPTRFVTLFVTASAAVATLGVIVAIFTYPEYAGDADFSTFPEIQAAPGPLAGAGLPVLLIGGLYWLYRRRRR